MRVQLAQRIGSCVRMDQHLTWSSFSVFLCAVGISAKSTFSRKAIPCYQCVSNRHYPTPLLTARGRISAASLQEFQAQKHYTAPAE